MNALIRNIAVSVVLTLMTAIGAQADDHAGKMADETKGPAEVVRVSTESVLAAIEDARDYIDDEPQRFYQEVESLMENVVDFRYFARGVMGKYGSKKYYNSLDEDGKAEFRDRVDRFTETFKSKLIETYAKGLLAFNGNRIEVLPVENLQPGRPVNVRQHIYGDNPQPYVIYYRMAQGKDGQWRLQNVSIQGMNMGKLYMRQFASAVSRNNGDVDKVIDNWSVSEPVEAVAEDIEDSED